MKGSKNRVEGIARLGETPEAAARFYFEELPAFFRAKHESTMATLDNVVAEMKQKIRKDRLKLEKAHPAVLREYLSELETHLKGWLKGSGPQDARHFGALAQEACRKLQEANLEALQNDSLARSLEELLEEAPESVGKLILKEEKAFAEDVYRQIALRLNEHYSQNLAFWQKPYEVKLHDGEIIERPVPFARDDGAWIGDSWIAGATADETEIFCPPAEMSFPVGIFHSYQSPGWLTFTPSGNTCKKASAVLSNVLFQRLLSGLPNVKIGIFDSGRSDIKDYEHDLCRDLPADPEEHEKLLLKFMDFGGFRDCMDKWLDDQPENYKKSRQNEASKKRLF